MLTIKYLRDNYSLAISRLQKRGLDKDQLSLIDKAITLDDERKKIQTQLDGLLQQINSLSKEIGKLYKSGQKEEAEKAKSKVAEIKTTSGVLETSQKDILQQLDDTLLQIPNIPHEYVPAGQTEEDNEVYRPWEGVLPTLHTDALPHWELAKKYNLIDFEIGVKITGAGFPIYRGRGARLQRALISFFLDQAHEAGYEEIIPPHVVNADSARATGQLPDKEGQMYYIPKDDLYLIPTAEVPVTNINRNVIIEEKELPIKTVAYTPCFRREAGSYGADVKGLNRLHQFDKVEIVQIANPERSYEVLDTMVDYVSGLLEKLELPYRILRLCGGDLGFTSAMTYDFEVFSAAQKRWLEVSSVSNFETFQANRLKLRIKDSNGKKQLAHTLNGSALALARIVAALLENHQTEAGIKIPKALIPYTKFDIIN